MDAAMFHAEATRSVVRVGKGRGFVVAAEYGRHYVVTAAHCLPVLPPANSLSARTYRELLGSLHGEPTVWAQCCYVDPVSDIAVLAEPDDQMMWHKSDAYTELFNHVPPLVIREAVNQEPLWLLGLDGEWFRSKAQVTRRIWLYEATRPILGGMSGSPLLGEDGKAVGILCVAAGTEDKPVTEGGPNACLANHLSCWLWKEITFAQQPPRAGRSEPDVF